MLLLKVLDVVNEFRVFFLNIWDTFFFILVRGCFFFWHLIMYLLVYLKYIDTQKCREGERKNFSSTGLFLKCPLRARTRQSQKSGSQASTSIWASDMNNQKLAPATFHCFYVFICIMFSTILIANNNGACIHCRMIRSG